MNFILYLYLCTSPAILPEGAVGQCNLIGTQKFQNITQAQCEINGMAWMAGAPKGVRTGILCKPGSKTAVEQLNEDYKL